MMRMARTLAVAFVCMASSPAMASEQLTETAIEAIHEGLAAPLSGTFLNGGSDAPVVLILPGSGPTDRDGNSPLGVSAATYRLLAEALAKEGISTVRVDKRGMFGSAAATPDANDVTIRDYAQDTTAWVDRIKHSTGNDCVWLLGHSEGGVVALASAAAISDDLCGIILAASPGRKLGDILREQLSANPANAPILDQAEAAITALETGAQVAAEDLHPGLLPLFGPQIQGFMRSLLSQEPAALAAQYDGPILVLHGEEDVQISAADAESLIAAQPLAKLVSMAGVNHVLKQVPQGDRRANLMSYRNPDLPLAEAVIEAVVPFVKQQR